MTVDTKEVARRFADASGELFVTLDSPAIRAARASNETMFDRVRNDPRRYPALFATSPGRYARSARIGDGLLGEWWTKIRLTGPDIRIGRDVNLLGHGGISIGAGARIGDRVQIVTIGHPNNPVQRNTAHTGGPVDIRAGARIGSGSVLVAPRGRRLVIGRDARVADSSFVKADVPAGAAVSGVPARPMAEPVGCSMCSAPAAPAGFEAVRTGERAREIFGEGADVKFPIYVRGAGHVAVVGNGRVGINRRAVFDAGGEVTITAPFKMATDASIAVRPGASLHVGTEAFLYAGASVVARGAMTLGPRCVVGAMATVDRDVAGDAIVGGHNRVLGRTDGDPIDPSVMPEWNDPGSLAPKVKAFQEEKKPLASLSLRAIRRRAVEDDRALAAFRSRGLSPPPLT